jgi:hypothetical protein
MALPEFTKRLVESKLSSYCEQRVPLHVRDRVKLAFKIRGNSVTLFEQRPVYREKSKWVDIPVAQFRFNLSRSLWTLYCADRNSKWHEYLPAALTRDFDMLLAEVDKDPTGIFWG